MVGAAFLIPIHNRNAVARRATVARLVKIRCVTSIATTAIARLLVAFLAATATLDTQGKSVIKTLVRITASTMAPVSEMLKNALVK